MNEEAKKALYYGRPFILESDYNDVKEGNFKIAGERVNKRSLLILAATVVVGLVFLTNALSSLLIWIDMQDSRSMTAFALWSLISVVVLVYGVRHYRRLSKVAKWLRKQTQAVEQPVNL